MWLLCSWLFRTEKPEAKQPPATAPPSDGHPSRWQTCYQIFSHSIPSSPRERAFLAVGVVGGIVGLSIYRRHFRRIATADWVQPDLISNKAWIKGRVISVTDADGFRLYHMPGPGWEGPFNFRSVPEEFSRKDMSAQTISVRIAAVDAPEKLYFGKKEKQKWHDESKAWLKEKIEGKTIYCQLLLRDQYKRIVAMPHLKAKHWPICLATSENVSESMLRAGWAEVYTQAGAQYGDMRKEQWDEIEKEAISARRGMWQDDDVERPSEFKRRHAAERKLPVETVESLVVEVSDEHEEIEEQRSPKGK